MRYAESNPIYKQELLEKKILEYDKYHVKNLLTNNLDRSNESKIFTNIFKGFDKKWTFNLSKYTINNYRYFKSNFKKYNIDSDSFKDFSVFILISLGSLNCFSLGIKKLLDNNLWIEGCRYNECAMLIGSHIVKHFIRIYEKELKRFKIIIIISLLMI